MPATLSVRWAWPTLAAGFTTINLDNTGSQTDWSFSTTQDVLFQGPSTVRTLRRVQTSGGRNIIFLGGKYASTWGSDSSDATLKFTNINGEAWIEGVHIDQVNTGERDAIAAYAASGATQATVTIQNSRIDNVKGTDAGIHGDVFQAHGNLGHFRAYRVHGNSTFQGLFLRRAPSLTRELLSVTLDHVDMKINPNNDVNWNWAYYVRSDSGVTPYSLDVTNTYVRGRGPDQFEPTHNIFPTNGTVNGRQVTFPGTSQWKGCFTIGAPPGGDIITAAQCGIGYTRDIEAAFSPCV